MKGLRKVLTPFAPDQSGAVSVLYELGGIIVIVDAGGCAGNICGFDEPRWQDSKSAVFSAGLRDMDAVMGRDDRLLAKIYDAASKIEANFMALIGTPVPAVIATDYTALGRMIEKKTGIPALGINTNGMELYDAGADKALYAVYDRFACETCDTVPGREAFIGACPADTGTYLRAAGMDEIRSASSAAVNTAVSPAAVRTVKLLERRFGTPWRAGFEAGLSLLPDEDFTGKRVLIVHQQAAAETLKDELLKRGAAKADTATWFMINKEIGEDTIRLKEEDDFEELAGCGRYDVIIADIALKPLAGDFKGVWVDAPHFALSGRT